MGCDCCVQSFYHLETSVYFKKIQEMHFLMTEMIVVMKHIGLDGKTVYINVGSPVLCF